MRDFLHWEEFSGIKQRFCIPGMKAQHRNKKTNKIIFLINFFNFNGIKAIFPINIEKINEKINFPKLSCFNGMQNLCVKAEISLCVPLLKCIYVYLLFVSVGFMCKISKEASRKYWNSSNISKIKQTAFCRSPEAALRSLSGRNINWSFKKNINEIFSYHRFRSFVFWQESSSLKWSEESVREAKFSRGFQGKLFSMSILCRKDFWD